MAKIVIFEHRLKLSKMTFKTGDRVKFLNDVGGGIITKIRQETAYIETSDGFEIPAPFSDLIKVDDAGFGGMKPQTTHSSKSSDKNPEPVREEIVANFDSDLTEDVPSDEVITSENCTLNILLGLVPVKLKGRMEPEFQVYMISDCAYRMVYTLSVVKDNFVYGNKVGQIEDDSKEHIATFSMSELKQIQSFKINCIFYKKGIYLPHEPLIYEYKVDALAMADPSAWTENDYFDEKAIVVNITEMSLIYEIERLITETEEKYIIQKKRKDVSPKKQPVSKPANADDVEEVDLHIEQLVNNASQLSAAEILEIQMGRFNIALTGAIRSSTRKIVFIHGVGNGKLKHDIRHALDTQFPKLRYQDASFKEYGYGATLVIIK
jgi:hypothetical protein